MKNLINKMFRDPISAGATLGIGLGKAVGDNIMDLAFARPRQKIQLEGQKKALEQQNAAQLDMWNKTNYEAQMKHLNAAGLNPGLLYGMSGGGATTTGSASAMPGPVSQGHGMDIGQATQLALLNAQRKNIEADTENKKAENPNIPKTGKEIDSRTQNNILEGIIKKYGGQEAERQWNINKELSSEEYGAKANELEARQAQAANIVRLWEDGTMKKMSDAELRAKLAEIGLKNVQITAQEIDNAISELEKKMQAELGIDRTAPTWLKMAGRLILGLMGKGK